MEKVGAIILAAGKGTRMKSTTINKVVLEVNDKPLILRTIENLKKAEVKEIVVVVGFAKESVLKILPSDIKIAVQKKQLGTADAEKAGLTKISASTQQVFSMYGDDTLVGASEIYKKMLDSQKDLNTKLTLATIIFDDPTGFGRIVRDDNGDIERIVEEANATLEERAIKEVNTGFYLFDKKALMENIGSIRLNELKSEYYLTDIIEIFINKGYRVGSVAIPSTSWQGVNNPNELKKAEEILKNYGR